MRTVSKLHFVLLMALIMAAGPFAIDAYLPAIPSISEYLGVGVDSVATTISFYIFGMALGQLVGGPLADNFEKRTIIIAGLLLYALSSLVIASVESLYVIQISRVFQAIGGGFAAVCVAPLVRMHKKGNDAAKLFGVIALVMIIAPAIAPSIGALILRVGQWQNIFYFTSIYALFVAILVTRSLPKSTLKLDSEKVPVYLRYKMVLKDKIAIRYLLIQASSYSLLMVFVTNASFIYQGHFNLGEQAFGLFFAANTIVNILVNRSNSKLLNQHSAKKLLRLFVSIQAVFVVLLILFTALEVPVSIYSLGVMGAVGLLGGIMPNTNALYMSQFQEHTGTASALLGTVQFLSGALMGGLTTLAYNATLWPVIMAMTFLVVCSNLLIPKKQSSFTLRRCD